MRSDSDHLEFLKFETFIDYVFNEDYDLYTKAMNHAIKVVENEQNAMDRENEM
tara:strand:- start:574 stop:732 length:159 start_codon:yes stop_codon:yes gene_type:complete